MILQALVAFILSTIDAITVDLPDPDGPVTSISPLFSAQRSITSFGILRVSASGIFISTRRSVSDILPLCLYAFTRNLPASGIDTERSISPSSSNFSRCSGFMRFSRTSNVSDGVIRGNFVLTSSPCILNFGKAPTLICTSDACSTDA